MNSLPENLEERLSVFLRESGRQIPSRRLPFHVVASRRALRTRILVVLGVSIGLGAISFGAWQLLAFRDSRVNEPMRVVVSPYVEVRSHLVSEPETVLFTASSDHPTYWRTAALDTYQNPIWTIAGDFEDVDGALPEALSSTDSDTLITQDIEVIDLGAIWLPAAPEPFEAVATGADLSWKDGSLTVTSDIATSDGVALRVRSGRANLTADDLRAAAGPDPELLEQYLRYGSDALSESARVLGREITAGETTRYDQARALQDYFRGFAYDTDAVSNRLDPIDGLLDERAGFAPQFASAFAVMARDLAIPSRVAVGFTWGDPVVEESDMTTYSVTGRHAHAWPEIYFPGIGWVPFEPTPGRGIPGATAYTGVTPTQDSLIQPEIP